MYWLKITLVQVVGDKNEILIKGKMEPQDIFLFLQQDDLTHDE